MRSVRITTARGASPVWTTPSLPPLLSDVSGVSDVELIFFVTGCVTDVASSVEGSAVEGSAVVSNVVDSSVVGSAVVGSA